MAPNSDSQSDSDSDSQSDSQSDSGDAARSDREYLLRLRGFGLMMLAGGVVAMAVGLMLLGGSWRGQGLGAGLIAAGGFTLLGGSNVLRGAR